MWRRRRRWRWQSYDDNIDHSVELARAVTFEYIDTWQCDLYKCALIPPYLVAECECTLRVKSLSSSPSHPASPTTYAHNERSRIIGSRGDIGPCWICTTCVWMFRTFNPAAPSHRVSIVTRASGLIKTDAQSYFFRDAGFLPRFGE